MRRYMKNYMAMTIGLLLLGTGNAFAIQIQTNGGSGGRCSAYYNCKSWCDSSHPDDDRCYDICLKALLECQGGSRIQGVSGFHSAPGQSAKPRGFKPITVPGSNFHKSR